MQKKQIPRKHVAKKCTEQQESIIKRIQTDQKLSSWLEAKHEYFENQLKYDAANVKSFEKEKITLPWTKEESKGTPAQQIADTTPDPKKPRETMTVEQTKLGVTMVLSKDDCKLLAFTPDTHTKEVIAGVRKQLGLPSREAIRAKKKK